MRFRRTLIQMLLCLVLAGCPQTACDTGCEDFCERPVVIDIRDSEGKAVFAYTATVIISGDEATVHCLPLRPAQDSVPRQFVGVSCNGTGMLQLDGLLDRLGDRELEFASIELRIVADDGGSFSGPLDAVFVEDGDVRCGEACGSGQATIVLE